MFKKGDTRQSTPIARPGSLHRGKQPGPKRRDGAERVSWPPRPVRRRGRPCQQHPHGPDPRIRACP